MIILFSQILIIPFERYEIKKFDYSALEKNMHEITLLNYISNIFIIKYEFSDIRKEKYQG